MLAVAIFAYLGFYAGGYFEKQNKEVIKSDTVCVVKYDNTSINALKKENKEIYDQIKKLKNVSSAQLGYVEYLNEDANNGFTEYNPFKKGHDYAYQNEIRVTFVDDTQTPVSLDVGDLHDIAVPLYKDSFKDIYMKDGKLFYPIYTATATEKDSVGDENV